MPGIGIGISFEFHEQPADGSFCNKCGKEIFGNMFKFYLSVNTGDPLRFELIESKYNFCEPCKIESENDDKPAGSE